MIEVEDQSGIALIRMNHGKVNALDLELLNALATSFDEAKEARAIVLTGSGKIFSAGVDIQRIVAGGTDYTKEFLAALTQTCMTIFDFPRPVVAAINGHAIAGGCIIAAACDSRIMAQGTIGLVEMKVGLPLPPSGIEIMRHAAGSFLTRLLFYAELLTPSAAQEIGLVDRVETPEDLIEGALKQASALAEVPNEIFALTKRQLHSLASREMAARQSEDQTVTALWCDPSTQSGVAAYLEDLESKKR